MILVNLAHESIFVYCTFNSVNLIPRYHSVIERAVFPPPPPPLGVVLISGLLAFPWLIKIQKLLPNPSLKSCLQLLLLIKLVARGNWSESNSPKVYPGNSTRYLHHLHHHQPKSSGNIDFSVNQAVTMHQKKILSNSSLQKINFHGPLCLSIALWFTVC